MYYYKTWNLLNAVSCETEKGPSLLESTMLNQAQTSESAVSDKRLRFYPVKYLLKFLIQ